MATHTQIPAGWVTHIGGMLRGMRAGDLSPTLKRGIRATGCATAVCDLAVVDAGAARPPAMPPMTGQGPGSPVRPRAFREE